ncbi:MAG: undecaprenyldiphospho-muramoylpentapeptide beta-N-acetylglucosaminyltransferase [Candidatus Nealsonbacteria bacterium]
MKILFTGGGSGGHITPLIAITRELRKLYTKEDLKFFFIGPKDEFSSVLLSQEGIKVKSVLSGKIIRYGKLKTYFNNFIGVTFKIPIGIIQSFFNIFFISPDVVFSRGGFGSIPVVIAAKMLFIPVFLHESDIVPGMANRFLNKFAEKIFISFPKTEFFSLDKIILTGNPIRVELLTGNREVAKQMFGLKSGKPILLILGGSQGAQRINDKILESLSPLLDNFEIIHQTGYNNFKTVKSEALAIIGKAKESSYHPFPFLKEPELKQAYAVADLIISRSGSGGIFEIAAMGKPSILIPLPESAQNHQILNAYAYAEKKAGIVIEENNFTSNFFLEKVKAIFSNPAEIEKMSVAAKEFARPNAAKMIANYLIEYLK